LVSETPKFGSYPAAGALAGPPNSTDIYINEGLAMLAKTQIDFQNAKLRSFLNIYHNTVTKPRFSTLEPPAAAGSAGGRGKSRKNKGCRARKRVKKCIFSADQG
jgi:hypothetical protein